MSLRLCSTGLVVDENSSLDVPGFVDAIIKGVGQVFLQSNSYTGLFFLAGIFYNSLLFGTAVLVGTVVSTITALLLRFDSVQIRAGLFGFNGALVGVALTYFLQPDSTTWICVIFASASSAIVMFAMMRLLSAWKIPTLTAPFVFTTLIFLFACMQLGRPPSAHALPTATVERFVTFSTLIEGLFKGIAQVFFQENAVTGGLFALGLLVNSRRACAMALLGSLIGLLTAWGLGAAEPAIRSGAFAFNCVLTAIALGGTLLALSTASAIYTALATIATVFMSTAISTTLEPFGMPALTFPFVVVVWIFVGAIPLFPWLRDRQ